MLTCRAVGCIWTHGFLAGLALGKLEEGRGYFKRILSRLDAGTIDVVIPQVVMGEAVSIIMRDAPASANPLDATRRMLEDVRDLADPKNRMPPTTASIADMAKTLSKRLRLQFTDALILSHALCDPNSTNLITDDRKLLSEGVKEVEMEMRSSGKRRRRLLVGEYI